MIVATDDARAKSKARHGARINLHHIVFAASAPEMEVTLDGSKMAPGDEIGVNFVSLNPYYSGDN